MAAKEKQPEVVDQLQREIETAEAASKSRLKAPEISVTAKQIPHKEFVEQYAPECVGKDAKFHAFWDEPSNHSANVSRGYIPVRDPLTRKQVVGVGANLLYKLPIELHNRNLREVSGRSERILSRTNKKTDVKAEHGSMGTMTEEISVTKGSSDNLDEAVVASERELAEAS